MSEAHLPAHQGLGHRQAEECRGGAGAAWFGELLPPLSVMTLPLRWEMPGTLGAHTTRPEPRGPSTSL